MVPTNEEFAESFGHNVEVSAAVSMKNKHNSSVVTAETMMRLSASPGAHGDAVREANGKPFLNAIDLRI